MIWVEVEYAQRLGAYLTLFKTRKTRPYLATFRCPICGDSQHNKTKTRGYIYQRDDHLFFYCHNCNASMVFKTFLKKQNESLYQEFLMSTIKEGIAASPPRDTEEEKVQDFISPVPLFNEEKTGVFDQLIPSKDAPWQMKDYLVSRKIPENRWDALFYVEDFSSFIKKIFPDKDIHEPSHPRIVIPIYDTRFKEIVGVSGRRFPDADPFKHKRYYTITKKGHPKLWIPRATDSEQTVYVTEGIMDALFIDNAISMLGSNIDTSVVRILYPDFVFIFDNEPRNKQIVDQMDRKIKEGCKIVIWSDENPYKDINEMVINDFPPHLKDHTYVGLSALLRLAIWRKC